MRKSLAILLAFVLVLGSSSLLMTSCEKQEETTTSAVASSEPSEITTGSSETSSEGSSESASETSSESSSEASSEKSMEEEKEDEDDDEDLKEKYKNEEDFQLGEGVNGELPDIEYTYEGIANAAPGLYPHPNIEDSPSNYTKYTAEWEKNVEEELKKIKPVHNKNASEENPDLGEDASEEDIERLFKQLLYIAAYDYPEVETIDKWSYVIFKNDMENPFTHEKIEEDMNVNVEIVLDASGSMANKIGDKTMMEIAKEAIENVLAEMPENSKVGLRVFGHLGSNDASDMEESCGANKLIYPIDTLNIEGIKNALAPIQPTGWTSIAKSIENGVADLSAFGGEKDLNILFIITDGIETCGGDPVETAKQLNDDNVNIAFGIIGFNVDANQDRVLKEIAEAGGGYYTNASNADKLTEELQKIHELAFSNYNWVTLDDEVLNGLNSNHNLGITYNNEINAYYHDTDLTHLIKYSPEITSKLYKKGGKVEERLEEMLEERQDKIKEIYDTEIGERVKESEEYLAYVNSRKGETVAVINASTTKFHPLYWHGPRDERSGNE